MFWRRRFQRHDADLACAEEPRRLKGFRSEGVSADAQQALEREIEQQGIVSLDMPDFLRVFRGQEAQLHGALQGREQDRRGERVIGLDQ